MARASKGKNTKKKRRSKTTSRKKNALPEVSLTKDLSLQLFAVSRYLGMDAERRLLLTIPMDVILQDPQVLAENPDLAADDKFYVKWEPGLFDGPTSARFAVVDYDGSTGQLHPPAQWDPALRKFRTADRVLNTCSVNKLHVSRRYPTSPGCRCCLGETCPGHRRRQCPRR